MSKDELEKLIFSFDKEKFAKALELNEKQNHYPLLNQNAEKLWEGMHNVKKLSEHNHSIVMDRTIDYMTLEEEEDFYILYYFVELIKSVFPEYDTWQAIKKMLFQYLGIKHLYVLYWENYNK